jgi:alkanesulfonate monooxygenase SsuD/methylene tetrahydromethanopterin reductase-like flavin-dependent oxidoreductase (luciferase family)
LQRSLLYQLGHREAAHLDQLVDEVLLAEQLAFESVWCLPALGEAGDFGLGAPEIWLAALAGCTKRIRLGWGLARVAPPRRAPIRSAEQGASLDLASKGRLDLALLPDLPDTEVEDDAAEPWDEGLRMLVEMWDRPTFSWTSKRFEIPPIDVLPKPVQSPHPPIWLVGWSLEHARQAGSAGLGLLDVSGGSDERLEMHRDAYVMSRSEADPNHLVCVSAFAAALDLETASEAAGRLASWEALGFDQAILRLAPLEDGFDATRAKIRLFASDSLNVH